MRYSSISGKPITLKRSKTTEDEDHDMNRKELLDWLNSGAAY